VTLDAWEYSMKQMFSRSSILGFLVILLDSPITFASDSDSKVIGKAVDKLPLFDAHVHYNEEAWTPFPPDLVLSLMDRSGVAMALVSSSPDDGTIKLWEYAPARVVPEMRPYREHIGQSNWTSWDGVGDYIERRVKEYPHQGIGEIHLHRINIKDQPLLTRIVDLALDKNIPLHVHSDRNPVKYLYSLGPGLTIIWAHAGMTEPPDVIEEMMGRYPTLYADTSYREFDILSGEGGIKPEWKRVLERFSDRFMVGSDTWANHQWATYDQLISINRQWLAYLTPESAHKIAYQNAERLFGIKVTSELIGTKK
jgi:WD40 repeat protein